jgi:hypothetical protein
VEATTPMSGHWTWRNMGWIWRLSSLVGLASSVVMSALVPYYSALGRLVPLSPVVASAVSGPVLLGLFTIAWESMQRKAAAAYWWLLLWGASGVAFQAGEDQAQRRGAVAPSETLMSVVAIVMTAQMWVAVEALHRWRLVEEGQEQGRRRDMVVLAAARVIVAAIVALCLLTLVQGITR